MPRTKPLVIAGERIRLGETREVALNFTENYLGQPQSVPVYVIRARKKGPRVFFTGGVHGDELNGMGVLRELVYNRPPKLLNGTLILAPVVNILGLENHSRYMPDRRDPNRCFPGSGTGSLTSRLSNALFSEIVMQCDYGIDFHSAAVRRTNYPNVRADLRRTRVRNLAKAFGCELIVDSKGPEGSLRRSACEVDVPTIILEAGEVWKIEPGIVELGVAGCMNVLKWLGMVRGAPQDPSFQVKVKKTTWVRASKGGILTFRAKPGQLVEQYECLATNLSILGREQTSLVAPCDGIVLGMTTMPAVKPGDPIYNIAQLPRRTFEQAQNRARRRSQNNIYSRIQDDLATNIVIQED